MNIYLSTNLKRPYNNVIVPSSELTTFYRILASFFFGADENLLFCRILTTRSSNMRKPTFLWVGNTGQTKTITQVNPSKCNWYVIRLSKWCGFMWKFKIYFERPVQIYNYSKVKLFQTNEKCIRST